jgi:CDP-diacylglycerol--serine O-phosphatidyltransferase
MTKAERRKRRILKTVAIFPTLLTLGNAFCGFTAIILVSIPDAQHRFVWAAWLLFVAMIFDALDGRVARMTGTAGEFGGQLDSLADAITFGLCPAYLAWQLVILNDPHPQALGPHSLRLVFGSGLFLACAMIRLARFNVENDPDPESHEVFAGLPTPAAGGLIAALIILAQVKAHSPETGGLDQGRLLVDILPFVTLALAVLMVSRFPYPHIAQRFFSPNQPFIVLVAIVVVLPAAAILAREYALSAFLGAYALTGPILWIRKRLKKKSDPDNAEEETDEPLF